MSKGWSDYFKDSMDLARLAGAFLAVCRRHHRRDDQGHSRRDRRWRRTIAELIGAGTLSEGLAVAGRVLASFYVGAFDRRRHLRAGQRRMGWPRRSTMKASTTARSTTRRTQYGEAQYAADTQIA
jgi:hypothetical protein